MDWGNISSFDIKSFSQKIKDTTRKIKEDVEKTVDEALGIEKKSEDNGGINYWQNDEEGDGWDLDTEIVPSEEEQEQNGDASAPDQRPTPPEAVDSVEVDGRPPPEKVKVRVEAEAAESKASEDAGSAAAVEESQEGGKQDEIETVSGDRAPEEPSAAEEASVSIKEVVQASTEVDAGGDVIEGDEGTTSGRESEQEESSGKEEEDEAQQLYTETEGAGGVTREELNPMWIKETKAKLLVYSQQIANLLQESDDQKSRIAYLEEDNKKLSREKAKMAKKNQSRSHVLAKLRKKENEVQEILEEGEKLSKRQHDAEQTIKKLRAKVKDLENAQKKAEDKGLGNVDQVHKQILSLEKENRDLKSSAETMDGQLESYQRRIQELQELQSETEGKALESIERLRLDLKESSVRLQETEAQYADIAVNVPEATKPLVDQVERLQRDLASKEETWSSVENTLLMKIKDLENSVRQYQKQEVAQQQLLQDGADQIRRLTQEKRDLLESKQSAVDGAQEGPAADTAKSDQMQAQLAEERAARESLESQILEERWKRESLEAQILEEKWKRESLEIDIKKLEKKVGKSKGLEGQVLEERKKRETLQAEIKKLETKLERRAHRREKSEPESAVDYSLKAKLAMALELVGEREEEIEHLHSDLLDLKRLYQEHVNNNFQ